MTMARGSAFSQECFLKRPLTRNPESKKRGTGEKKQKENKVKPYPHVMGTLHSSEKKEGSWVTIQDGEVRRGRGGGGGALGILPDPRDNSGKINRRGSY